MSRKYSHTALKMFQRCAKKWSYRYVGRLKPKRVSPALVRGRELHDLFQLWYSGEPIDPDAFEKDDLDLLVRYAERWDSEDEEWEILHVEEDLEMKVDGYTLVYKPDLVVRINGDVWVVDHKTTANIPDEWDPYNMTDFQHLLYIAGIRELYPEVKGFLFNYVRTKVPTPPKLVKDGSRVADVRRVDTTPEMLRAFAEEHGVDDEDVRDRLRIMALAPDRWFQRHYILVNDEAVDQVIEDTLQVLSHMDRAEREGTYPRHVVAKHGGTQACSYCEYQPLCHSELLGMNTEIVLLDYEKSTYKEKK